MGTLVGGAKISVNAGSRFRVVIGNECVFNRDHKVSELMKNEIAFITWLENELVPTVYNAGRGKGYTEGHRDGHRDGQADAAQAAEAAVDNDTRTVAALPGEYVFLVFDMRIEQVTVQSIKPGTGGKLIYVCRRDNGGIINEVAEGLYRDFSDAKRALINRIERMPDPTEDPEGSMPGFTPLMRDLAKDSALDVDSILVGVVDDEVPDE